jgi:hypothetical protein
MSALTTAAIIGLAVGAGSQVASSAIQAHQTGKAVDAQTEAANKALALQQQQYQQARTDAAPYQALGQSTLGRLGQMAAQPQAQFNPSNYFGGAPTSTYQQSEQARMGTPSQSSMPSLGMGGASGALQGLGGMAAPGQMQSGPMPGQQQIAAGAQGDTVTIQTPDGRTLQGFPRAKVSEAMQRGARVVG